VYFGAAVEDVRRRLRVGLPNTWREHSPAYATALMDQEKIYVDAIGSACGACLSTFCAERGLSSAP
jgi:hypothetical protein